MRSGLPHFGLSAGLLRRSLGPPAITGDLRGAWVSVVSLVFEEYGPPERTPFVAMVTMTVNDQAFDQLVARLRAGEPEAFDELASRYVPEVTLAIGTLLRQSELRRRFDSMDVVQSVLHRFSTKVQEGRYELESPAHLLALLNRMAHNKFMDYVRREGAQERDYRRGEAVAEDLPHPQRQPSPSTIVGWREEFREIQRRLTDEERRLIQAWATGKTWPEIAGEDRKEQDRARHQFEAALKRVAAQLSQLRDEEVRPEYLRAIARWTLEQSQTLVENVDVPRPTDPHPTPTDHSDPSPEVRTPPTSFGSGSESSTEASDDPDRNRDEE